MTFPTTPAKRTGRPPAHEFDPMIAAEWERARNIEDPAQIDARAMSDLICAGDCGHPLVSRSIWAELPLEVREAWQAAGLRPMSSRKRCTGCYAKIQPSRLSRTEAQRSDELARRRANRKRSELVKETSAIRRDMDLGYALAVAERHGLLGVKPAGGEALGPVRVEEWTMDAACSPTTAEIFFPDRAHREDAALAICGRCPVREQCLATAISRREQFGVWGGYKPAELRVIYREAGSPGARSRALLTAAGL